MKAHLIRIPLCAMALAGCAAAPVPIEYYVLAPAVQSRDSVVERADKPTVVIENVELAAYLRQPGLVMQTGNNQLVISKTHLWAESLELALPKALVRDLQRQSDDYSYYLKTLDWVGEADYRLRLRIDSLQATDQGEVVASGRFQLIPGSAAATPVFVDFSFRRELQQDGYAYAVEQMRGLLAEIAGAILASVDKLAGES